MAKKGRMVYQRRCERDADTNREKNVLNLNKEQVRETRRLASAHGAMPTEERGKASPGTNEEEARKETRGKGE